MSLGADKRTLDPEQVHQIWLAILSLLKQLNSSSNEASSTTATSEVVSCVSISSLYDQLKSDKTEPPPSSSASSSSSNSNSNSSSKKDVESIVLQAIKEGLLIKTSGSEGGLTNGTTTSDDPKERETFVSLPLSAKPPTTSINGFMPHDWYCFGCHQVTGNQLIGCNQCWRVYHSACVQSDYEFAVKLEPSSQASAANESPSPVIRARNFVCPVCTLTQKFAHYTIGSRLFSQAEFNQILGYTFQAFLAKSSQISRNLLTLKDLTQSPLSTASLSACLAELSSSSSTVAAPTTSCELTTHLALQYLTYKAVDTSDIDTKLKQSSYQSLGEFLGDCLAFKHTVEVAVVAGNEASRRRVRDTLNRMLDACRYDLSEMLGCIDCYQNSNRINDDKFWFCRPCNPPHMLVFAKQKGFPYWPAKVIKPRNPDSNLEATPVFDVRFFGGNHERLSTDKKHIKDINSSLAELQISKANSSLEKAFAELRVHRELLEKFEKGLDTDLHPDEHVDGHKVLSKRKYNRRQSATTSRKQPDSANSSDEPGPASKRKGAAVAAAAEPQSEAMVGKAKNKRARVRSRSSTADSDRTLEDVKTDTDAEEKAAVAQSDPETNASEDLFEDAREEQSESQNDEGNDPLTDVDDAQQSSEQEEEASKDSAAVEPKGRRAYKKRDRATSEEEDRKPIPAAPEASPSVKRPRGRPRKYFPSPDGRPSAPSTSANANSAAPSTPKKGRIRRTKVLYSPVQTHKVSKPVAPLPPPSAPEPPSRPPASSAPVISQPVRVSARGRKPKSLSIRSPSPLRVASPIMEEVKSPKSRGRPRGRGRKSSPTRLPVKVLFPDSQQTTSRVERQRSPSPSPASRRRDAEKKVTEKSQRRRQNIERQRQLIQARRKKFEKVVVAPKHIPPVTATKSSPAFSTPSTALNHSITSPLIARPLQKPPSLPVNLLEAKPLLSSHLPSTSNMQLASPNGFNSPLFSFASQNGYINSQLAAAKSQAPASFPPPAQLPNGVPQHLQLPPPPPLPQTVPVFRPPPSSIMKPLINGEASSSDTDSHSSKLQSIQQNGIVSMNGVEEMESNGSTYTYNGHEQGSSSAIVVDNTIVLQQFGNANAAEDDDEEPYLYDDEQLEEQINEYVNYQKEKEQFEKEQMKMQLYEQQQQLMQQEQMLQQMHLQQQQQLNQTAALQNGYAHHGLQSHSLPAPPSPTKAAKSRLLLDPPPKKYLEYSSSCIYSPTRMNQNLVNHYMHQYSTDTATKSDYLAQLVLRKDEFEQMDRAAEQAPAAARKRGRPPKNAADDAAALNSKAKSIVEKSYLQESACDRACLTKNVKAFKRFRDFVEAQRKEEISKHKRELEELKQEVDRLKNQKDELENDLKQEREKSKRCDPAALIQLERRYKMQISDIKRKQWCINCEAEASYFCCYNTNYCSPECQHKHWFSGHQTKCARRASQSSSANTRKENRSTDIVVVCNSR